MVVCYVRSPLDIPRILPLFHPMPRFTAIACLFAFITNAMVGGMGGILLCAHDAGGTHWFEPAEHEESSHGPCCHHEGDLEGDVALELGDCASCEDTLLRGLSQGAVVSSQERPSLKAPVSSVPGWHQIRAAVLNPRRACLPGVIRAPSMLPNARDAFTDTVRILC